VTLSDSFKRSQQEGGICRSAHSCTCESLRQSLKGAQLLSSTGGTGKALRTAILVHCNPGHAASVASLNLLYAQYNTNKIMLLLHALSSLRYYLVGPAQSRQYVTPAAAPAQRAWRNHVQSCCLPSAVLFICLHCKDGSAGPNLLATATSIAAKCTKQHMALSMT
jgi:hypothetical protein